MTRHAFNNLIAFLVGFFISVVLLLPSAFNWSSF